MCDCQRSGTPVATKQGRPPAGTRLPTGIKVVPWIVPDRAAWGSSTIAQRLFCRQAGTTRFELMVHAIHSAAAYQCAGVVLGGLMSATCMPAPATRAAQQWHLRRLTARAAAAWSGHCGGDAACPPPQHQHSATLASGSRSSKGFATRTAAGDHGGRCLEFATALSPGRSGIASTAGNAGTPSEAMRGCDARSAASAGGLRGQWSPSPP